MRALRSQKFMLHWTVGAARNMPTFDSQTNAVTRDVFFPSWNYNVCFYFNVFLVLDLQAIVKYFGYIFVVQEGRKVD